MQNLLITVIVWTVIAILLNRVSAPNWRTFAWHKGLTTCVILMGTVILGWLFLGMLQEGMYGSQEKADLFSRLLPGWYDRLVDFTIPTLLLVLGATAVVSSSYAGCAFRLACCFLLCRDWAFLGGSFPGWYAESVGVRPPNEGWTIFGMSQDFTHLPPVTWSALKPLMLENASAVVILLLLALIGYHLEKRKTQSHRYWF